MGNKIIADIYDQSYITDIHSSCVHYNVIHKRYVFLVFFLWCCLSVLWYSIPYTLVTHKSFLFLKQVSFCIIYISRDKGKNKRDSKNVSSRCLLVTYVCFQLAFLHQLCLIKICNFKLESKGQADKWGVLIYAEMLQHQPCKCYRPDRVLSY